MAPLSKAERETIRSRIATAQATLGGFRLYWLPEHRAVTARSLSCSRQFRVPDGALLVGTYSSGISAAEVVRDLDDVIASLPDPPPPPEAPELPPITSMEWLYRIPPCRGSTIYLPMHGRARKSLLGLRKRAK